MVAAMRRASWLSCLALALSLACRPSCVPTAELPSVADTEEAPVRPDAASDPAIEEPSARELGLEAKWRLREWGLERLRRAIRPRDRAAR